MTSDLVSKPIRIPILTLAQKELTYDYYEMDTSQVSTSSYPLGKAQNNVILWMLHHHQPAINTNDYNHDSGSKTSLSLSTEKKGAALQSTSKNWYIKLPVGNHQ